MKVKAGTKNADGVAPIAVLDDETAGVGSVHVRILNDGKVHEVEATHARVKELIDKGVLVEVVSKDAKPISA